MFVCVWTDQLECRAVKWAGIWYILCTRSLLWLCTEMGGNSAVRGLHLLQIRIDSAHSGSDTMSRSQQWITLVDNWNPVKCSYTSGSDYTLLPDCVCEWECVHFGFNWFDLPFPRQLGEIALGIIRSANTAPPTLECYRFPSFTVVDVQQSIPESPSLGRNCTYSTHQSRAISNNSLNK